MFLDLEEAEAEAEAVETVVDTVVDTFDLADQLQVASAGRLEQLQFDHIVVELLFGPAVGESVRLERQAVSPVELLVVVGPDIWSVRRVLELQKCPHYALVEEEVT